MAAGVKAEVDEWQPEEVEQKHNVTIQVGFF